MDVDSWIELDESGNISDRIIYFGHIGQDNGELIRYGGAKGFENIMPKNYQTRFTPSCTSQV
mgnify:CR=1 FL=1